MLHHASTELKWVETPAQNDSLTKSVSFSSFLPIVKRETAVELNLFNIMI
jgi:hypothetical protein